MTRAWARRVRARGAWEAGVILMLVYLAALVLVAVSMAIDFGGARALEDSGRKVSQAVEAMEKLRQTGNNIVIAESSERGYVITGNPALLATYRDMQSASEDRLDEIDRLIPNGPEQREGLGALRRLVTQSYAEMDRTLEAYASGGQAAAIATIDAIGTDGSTSQIRNAIGNLLDNERLLLEQRRAATSATYARSQIGSAVSSLVVVIALTAFYLLMRRYLRERDAALASIEANRADLEHRVLMRTAELSQLSRHLLQVRENEKKSIARDLHDELGAYLTAINMDVSRVRDKLQQSHPDQAAKLDRTLGLLGSAIEIKRRLISDLRPSILDNLGLGAALEQYIDEWSRYTGITATFDQDGDLETDQEGCGIAIFRVFQEALNNVAKHSGATAVRCHIRRVEDTVDFEIADNGIGLSDASRHKTGAHGLIGMRERILAYKGQLEFTRAPEGGTVLRASLSFARAEDPVFQHEDGTTVV